MLATRLDQLLHFSNANALDLGDGWSRTLTYYIIISSDQVFFFPHFVLYHFFPHLVSRACRTIYCNMSDASKYCKARSIEQLRTGMQQLVCQDDTVLTEEIARGQRLPFPPGFYQDPQSAV